MEGFPPNLCSQNCSYQSPPGASLGSCQDLNSFIFNRRLGGPLHVEQ